MSEPRPTSAPLTPEQIECLETLREQLADTEGGYAAQQYRALDAALAALAPPPPAALPASAPAAQDPRPICVRRGDCWFKPPCVDDCMRGFDEPAAPLAPALPETE